MKRNILTKGILSLIALGALCFTTACSDIDNVKEDGNTSKGLRFTVTDIQVSKEASLPQRSEKSVYETQRIAFQNANGLDVCIKETTVEGVNAVQQQDNGTRAELKTSIDKDFSVFASKDGGNAADFMFNAKARKNGSLYQAIEWTPRKAGKLQFHAVYPLLDASNPLQVLQPTTNNGTAPRIEFTVNSDIKKQTDLMLATTKVLTFSETQAQNVDLSFNHATTAIRFKVGNKLGYSLKITKIEINNVYGKADLDIKTGTWSNHRNKTSFTFTPTTPISTALNIRAIITGGENTFLMIPQTLPADANIKIYIEGRDPLTAAIGGKVWTSSTTKTYGITNDDVRDWDYTFEVSVDHDAIAYNAGGNSFKIKSFRHLKGYSGTDRDLPVKWQYLGYSINGGLSWNEGTDNFITAVTENGVGAVTDQPGVVTINNPLIDMRAKRIEQMRQATQSTGVKDLSLDENGRQSTANCYVITAPGTYSFPLVYGNAIKNGVKNESAYKVTNLLNGFTLTNFQDSKGNISQPKINGVKKVEMVELNETGLITDLQGSTSTGEVTFKVPQANLKEGNVLIRALDNNDKVLWSWHLWFTSEDVINTSTSYFALEPLGYRHTKWEKTSYDQTRTITLKFKNEVGTIITKSFTIAAFEDRQGTAPYYQHGRKDPFVLGKITYQPNAYYQGMTLKEAVGSPLLMANARRFENSMPKGNWDWCKDTDKDRTYLNLWSTNNTTDGFIDGNVVKTVYDPCPAGFHMPKAQEFTKVNAGNNHKKVFAPNLQVLHPDLQKLQDRKNGKGLYWTAERYLRKQSSVQPNDQAYFGCMVLATDNTFEYHDAGIPLFMNMQFGLPILPIKD